MIRPEAAGIFQSDLTTDWLTTLLLQILAKIKSFHPCPPFIVASRKTSSFKNEACTDVPLWKVMEFHSKATVRAVFMFDISDWVYFCLFSDRLPCGVLIPLCLLLLSHLHSLCSVLCFFLFLFSTPCSSLSFSTTLMLSVVSLGVIVLTLFHSL